MRPGLDEHVKSCESCRRAWDQSRRALEVIAGGVRDCATEGLEARVVEAGRAQLTVARRRRRLASVCVLVAAASLLLVATWMLAGRSTDEALCGCWRYVAGDPGNSRHSDYALRGTPDRVLWERRVQGTAGAFKPLAWKRLIVVGAHPGRKTHRGGGRLLAFDAVSGEVRWQRDFESGDFYKAKGFPDRCILGGVLYVTDSHSCLALELSTGRQLGRFDPPEEAMGWSYLTGEKDRLYGLSRDGRTAFCVEAASGRALWSRATGGKAFVPALVGNRMYLSVGDGSLLALDTADGRRIWRVSGSPGGRSSVHACGEHLLVMNSSDDVAAFSALGGGRLWSRNLKGAFASGAAMSGHVAYLLAGTTALSLSDGAILWQHGEDASGLCSAPTLTGDRVLAAAGKEAGSLNVFAATGRVEASFSGAARRACDGAIVAGGRIYAVGGGTLRAMACSTKG